MPDTRRIQGEVAFPADSVRSAALRITIELRDVSMQDQPSVVLASKVLTHVPIGPNARVAFEFSAPAVTTGRLLAMRVQVDMQDGLRHAPGDYLSTVSVPVPAAGDVRALVVPVTRF